MEFGSLRQLINHGSPFLFGVCLSVVTLCTATAQPDFEGSQALDIQASHANPFIAPLSWYSGNDAPIYLRNQESSADIVVPLQAGRALTQATLNLAGMSSAALLPSDSHLLVSVNGTPVQQIVLNAAASKFNQTLSLPLDLFNKPYNTVTFSVAQTSGEQCERFDAPQLWTSVLQSSTLSLSYADHPLALNLASLGDVFDKHLWAHQANVTILYDSRIAVDPQAIMNAAQSAAIRYDYIPLTITALPLNAQNAENAESGRDNVIILGTYDDLDTKVADKPGSDARVQLQSDAGGGVVLTIAGKNASFVAGAARLIGEPLFAWPSDNVASISFNGSAPNISNPPVQHNTGEIDFGSTGFKTQTATAPTGSFPQVTFWNPDWNDRLVLHLHLTYTGGLAGSSMVEVLSNGILLATVPLNLGSGGTYPDYTVALPQDVLEPGPNQLLFQPVLQAQDYSSGACVEHDRGDHLSLTMFGDSRISVVGGERLAQGNLAALPAGALPISTVALTSSSPEVFSAAATFGARLAQLQHQDGTRLSLGIPRDAVGNIVVMGNWGSLKQSTQDVVKADLSADGLALTETPLRGNASLGNSGFYLSKGRGSQEGLIAGPIVASDFGSSTIVAAKQGGGATVVVFTAASDTALQKGMDALVGWTRWGQLAGSVSIISPQLPMLETVPAKIVPSSLRGYLGYVSSMKPLVGLTVLLVAFLLGIIMVRITVKRRLGQKFSGIKTRDDAK